MPPKDTLSTTPGIEADRIAGGGVPFSEMTRGAIVVPVVAGEPRGTAVRPRVCEFDVADLATAAPISAGIASVALS
jgi:hypothetical protein